MSLSPEWLEDWLPLARTTPAILWGARWKRSFWPLVFCRPPGPASRAKGRTPIGIAPPCHRWTWALDLVCWVRLPRGSRPRQHCRNAEPFSGLSEVPGSPRSSHPFHAPVSSCHELRQSLSASLSDAGGSVQGSHGSADPGEGQGSLRACVGRAGRPASDHPRKRDSQAH
jgi:hypothetical protein